VGATVNFIDATLRDATTGVLADPRGVVDPERDRRSSRRPAPIISPREGLSRCPKALSFTLQGVAPAAPGRLAVTAQLTDDAGNIVGASVTATIE
jgi:hypothetical protein